MPRKILHAILILVFLQYTNPRVFKPVKTWTGGFVEMFTHQKISYKNLPWNKTAAEITKWKKWYEDNDRGFKLEIYCPRKNKYVCAILDEYGNIAGVQISIRSKHLKKQSVAKKQLKNFERKVIKGKKYYTLTTYFIVERTLRKGGRQRYIKYLGIGLWIRLGNTTVELSKNENDLVEDDWNKQSCENVRGTHYLKSNSTSCYLPYVPTVNNGTLVGMTFLIPGRCPTRTRKSSKKRRTKRKSAKTSLIGLSVDDVTEIYKNSPVCLLDSVKTQGLCTAHVGFLRPPPNGVECPHKTFIENVVDTTHSLIKEGYSGVNRMFG